MARQLHNTHWAVGSVPMSSIVFSVCSVYLFEYLECMCMHAHMDMCMCTPVVNMSTVNIVYRSLESCTKNELKQCGIKDGCYLTGSYCWLLTLD